MISSEDLKEYIYSMRSALEDLTEIAERIKAIEHEIAVVQATIPELEV